MADAMLDARQEVELVSSHRGDHRAEAATAVVD